MTQIPLGINAYKRQYARSPEVRLVNRFLEQDPTNLRQPVSLLARPGSSIFRSVGAAAHRGKFTQAGFFNGDLFVVAGSALSRVTVDGVLTAITGEILGTGNVDFAHMVGPGYAYLFIADGLLLQVYAGGSRATGILTVSATTPPNIAAQVIEIEGTYYTWGASVAGPDAGTSGNPWVALLGANDAESLVNMEKLINFSGIRGVTYSANLGGPSTVVTALAGALTLTITAISEGTDANAFTTTIFSGADMSWGDTTLNGGGVHALSGVEVPDGVGAASVASLSSFVLVAQSRSDRMYFLRPGEIVIDPLDFVTAESQPDDIVNLVSVGDLVWALGESTSEAWYATGDAVAPFAPMQGRVFTRGVIEGTAVHVKDNVVLVGADMVVYSIGGGIQRISDHGIEERIRTQLHREQAA